MKLSTKPNMIKAEQVSGKNNTHGKVHAKK